MARARRGDRGAVAVLLGRHAGAVVDRAAAQGLDVMAAAAVLRDVFRAAGRTLDAPAATTDARAWLRALTLDRLAEGAGRGARLSPATVAAVRATGDAASPEVRDAIWRELEREWRHANLSLWERHGATIGVTAGLAALFVAVLVVGSAVLAQTRAPAPTGAVRLTAQPVQEVAVDTGPPTVAPSVIEPRVEPEEPFVPPEEQPTTEPSPPAPAPSPEPSPTSTATPTEPEPTETEPAGTETPTDPAPSPTEEPTSEPPILPLPTEGGSEGASEGVSEGTATSTDGGSAGSGA